MDSFAPSPRVASRFKPSALAGPALALLAWEAGSRAGLIPARLLPPPSAICRALAAYALSGELAADAAASARRWALGLALGATLGAATGLVTGAWRAARAAAAPTLHFLRALPFMMLMPLTMLWFGFADAAKILLCAWGAFFPVWLAAQSAVLGVEKEYLWAARTLGAEGPRLWLEVLLPLSLPGLAAGLRTAVSTSMFALAAAEMVGSYDGLAYRAFYSYQLFQSAKMLACIACVGAAGLAADAACAALARRLAPWAEEASWSGR